MSGAPGRSAFHTVVNGQRPSFTRGAFHGCRLAPSSSVRTLESTAHLGTTSDQRCAGATTCTYIAHSTAACASITRTLIFIRLHPCQWLHGTTAVCSGRAPAPTPLSSTAGGLSTAAHALRMQPMSVVLAPTSSSRSRVAT
eukprot:2028298-Prymnesium_polylepis.1